MSCSGDGAGKRKSKKSQKRKNSSATDDHHENDINTDTGHDTCLDLHQTNVSNSTKCENTTSETQQSSVEVVTFIDPRKTHKLSKTVEPVQKVREKIATDLNPKEHAHW